MKTINFYARSNRSDDLLHIETDGCVINIHVGLTDADGRLVTAIEILPDAASRGGDGEGRTWSIADKAPSLIRVRRNRIYRRQPKEAKVDA